MSRKQTINSIFDIWNVKVHIPISIAFLAVLAPAIAIGLYYAFPGNREDLKFASTAIAVTASLVSAFYIGRNLRYNALSQKETRTLLFPNRWNDSSFSDAKKAIRRLRRELYDSSIPNLSVRRKKIEEMFQDDPDLELHLIDIFNFFEEMAVCVENGIVDETLLRGFFRSILIAYYESFEFWLVDRQGGKSLIFTSLNKIYREWSK